MTRRDEAVHARHGRAIGEKRSAASRASVRILPAQADRPAERDGQDDQQSDQKALFQSS
jgi:hypothetical protein